MMVFFLRHAEADPDRSSDFERKLTPKGMEQAEKAGKFCARNGLTPDIILTSPVVRAEETARIAAKKLGNVELVREDAIACGMTKEQCLELLRGYQEFATVMLVGHEPDFSETIAGLIGLPDSDRLQIRKSSLTAVDISNFKTGAGTLEFLVPSRLM
jgi:phosphohistidine phosphatase